MSDLYTALLCKKGAAWKEESIKKHSLLRRAPTIDKKAHELAGKSRVHGDASEETQKRVIDIIIEIGSRHNLTYRDIAHMLLIAKIESGFNPDAAAGSSSAGGIAQFTDATAEEAKKPHISKKILNFTLDIQNPIDRFDAEKGSYGLLLSFLICKKKAVGAAGSEYENYLYFYHHEGWYGNDTKEKIISSPKYQDISKIIKDRITSKIQNVESLLKKTTIKKFQIKDQNNEPKQNQPYIAITQKKKDNTKPPSAQQAEEVKIIHGKTDSNGNTAAIKTTGATEVIFLILNKAIWESIKQSSVAQKETKYTIKRGDSLSKIAKENNTTVSAIAKANNIQDTNSIQVGEELVINTTYTPKKPDKNLIEYALEALNLPIEAANSLCEYAKSHVILPKGSESQKNNSIAIKENPKNTATKKDTPTTKTTKNNSQEKATINAKNNDTIIIFAEDIAKPELISDHTINLLKKIGKDISLDKIIITSGIRPPKRQAQTMYSNIEAKGIASQKNMYSHAGDMIVDVYAQKKSQGLSKDEIIKAMTDKIIDLSDNGTRVSKHCVSEKQYNKLNVIDVSCKQMRASARIPFESAIEKMVKSGEIKKFINPRSVSGEPAYHLEIPQP